MNEEIKKLIEDFDSGAKVQSVDMGGFGYGYEVAIQECAMEALRILQDKTLGDSDINNGLMIHNSVNQAADALVEKYGFSGAQVGAAENIASVFFKNGPKVAIQMMADIDPSRIFNIYKEDGQVKIDKYEK
jgi:hypothetical protein